MWLYISMSESPLPNSKCRFLYCSSARSRTLNCPCSSVCRRFPSSVSQESRAKDPLTSLNVFLFKVHFFHARDMDLFKNCAEEERPSQASATGSYREHLRSSFYTYQNPKTLVLRGKEPQRSEQSGSKGGGREKIWKKRGKMYWGRKKNTLRPIRESNNYFTDLLMGLGLLRTCLSRFPAGMIDVRGRDPLLRRCACKSSKRWLKTAEVSAGPGLRR